ncbi:MAG: transporter substrate-binding domain-containing protein [Colwellia sp.]|nr:transporter substrate-binding domain-containing protein [Colwellia sp.]
MKKSVIIQDFKIIVLLLCSALSSPVHANEINVVTEYLSPYQIKNNDGSLGGFSTEVIHALFKITGDSPKIRVLPWARAYATAQYEKNTMIFSIAKTNKRLSKFHWIGDLIDEEYYFWALASNSTFSKPTLDALKQYRIATSRNSNEYEYLIEQEFEDIYPVVNEDQRTQMLYKERIDLIIETEITLKSNTQRLNLDFSKLSKLLSVDPLNSTLSIAFNLNSDIKLIKKYQNAFSQLKMSGQLLKLQEKWNLTNTSAVIIENNN